MKRKSGSIVIRTENIIRLGKLIPTYSRTDSKGNVIVSPEYDDIIKILLDSFETTTKQKSKKMLNIHMEDQELVNAVIDDNSSHISDNAAAIVYDHVVLLLQEGNVIPYVLTNSNEERAIIEYAIDKYYESR